jgi:hypothetical protein
MIFDQTIHTINGNEVVNCMHHELPAIQVSKALLGCKPQLSICSLLKSNSINQAHKQT